MQLTDGEKLIVAMLADIRKSLGGVPGIDPDFVMDAIHSGNTWALKWHYPGVFDPQETPDEVRKETLDILDMWSMLESSYGNLAQPDAQRIDAAARQHGNNVQFGGFDGNHESTHLSVARFLIEDMGRYAEFAGRGLNSHFPSLRRYQAMLAVFGPMRPGLGGGQHMTADQIIRVLAARDP